MANLDLRAQPDRECFGCGKLPIGYALRVLGAMGGPVLALLCDRCRADALTRERLAAALIAHLTPGRRRLSWHTGDPARPLGFAPVTQEAILARLSAGDSFRFAP